jgi:hypothetical protein
MVMLSGVEARAWLSAPFDYAQGERIIFELGMRESGCGGGGRGFRQIFFPPFLF